MELLWTLLCLQLVRLSLSLNGLLDDLPKIRTENGNLFIVSGKDKNITLQTTGNGVIFANGVNLLRPQSSITENPLRMGRVTRVLTGIQRDLDNPRTGIKSRLRALENRNGSETGAGPNRRFRQINQRITTLSTQVDTLLRKLEENNCRSLPCQNGGVCMDLFDGFLCQCPKNWEGPTCGLDVNECAQFAGTDLGCQNGASCVNTQGGYNCICANGYQGLHCTSQNLNCANGGAELCGNGVCIQQGATYSCICNQGWTTGGGTSKACNVDVNECLEHKPHCSKDPLVECVNLPGSFRCGSCPPGYSGNGYYCADINECDYNNGGCSMAPYVQCINTRGSSTCGNCPAGYTGDGRSCEGRADGTLGLCTPGLCHPLARCQEFGSFANCQCPPTHTGNGVGPNGCVLNTNPPCPLYPCKNGGHCNTSTLTCSCPAGTSLPYCNREDRDSICNPNPCRNNGQCEITSDSSIRCVCAPNFEGALCQRQKESCNAIMRGMNGTIRFPPGNSTTYAHNSRCAWLIRTSEEYVLNITFTKFEVEDATECRYDFLQIHDGATSAAQHLGRFCGSHLPPTTFLSTRNTLYMFFRSDSSSASGGFELKWVSERPTCGGTVNTTTYGTIKSPGAPGNYPPNRDCWWYLAAPPGKRIQFHFLTMAIEAHRDCSFDYLAIHDGHRDEANVLEKFCNTSHPAPFITPGHEAALHFHSDADSTDTGFQIHYSVVEGVPGCGGTFTALSGEFGTPVKDGSYPENLECEYLISMAPGTRIEIEFLEFGLEEHSDCSFDFLEIYEGATDRDPLVRKICGSDMPPPYKSLGSKLLFKFRSDYSNNNKGFRVSYKIVCGGTFTTESGVIQSPLYPNPYHKSRECVYEIVAPIGKSITLTFVDFDLEGNTYPDCTYDSVEVFDGVPDDSTSLGRYCGEMLPPPAISKQNLMTLKLTTDTSIEGRGFKATYTLSNSTCGGVIKDQNQTIVVNGADISQIHNLDCLWTIVAPINHTINLIWNSFDIEETDSCMFDYVEVFDGIATNRSQKYCGTQIPPVMTTVGNVAKIRFSTDSSVSSAGFSLGFTFKNTRDQCGGTYFGASGYLHSPNYPGNYPSFKNCEWIIRAPTGHQILLKPNAFAMEHHDRCNFDYLEVRNGGTSDAPLFGKYCGTEFPTVLKSFSNQVYLKLVTDYSHAEKGFEIEWESVATGCGGLLSSHEGAISSPNYPLPYDHNAKCIYRITTNQGSNINIVFTDLDLEMRWACIDSVEVLDGKTMASLTRGSICNNTTPFNLTTSDNSAVVIFEADASDSGRGFSLTYTSNCNRKLKGFSGVIESPNFPNPYPHHIDCVWTIDVPLGNKLGLEFSHFNLEVAYFTSGCDFDYLEIDQMDGETLLDKKRYCREKPNHMEVAAKSVNIRFHSDVSQSESGFRLEWRVQGCGGVLEGSGMIREDNTARDQPTQCDWKISASIGKQVELTIMHFQYENSGTCADEGLMVANNEDFDHPILIRCESLTNGTVVRSSGHQMYIRYIMKKRSFTSFEARYQEGHTDCGGTVTNQGVIMSTNYPNNYDLNKECEWLLEVKPDHSMSIVIEDIDLMESTNCQDTVLMIYDGDEARSDNAILRWCNSTTPKITKYLTVTSKALVKFTSGGQTAAKGFKISFETNCGYNIVTNSTGMINLHYSGPPKMCTWTIRTANPTERISLTINHFSGNASSYRDVLVVTPSVQTADIMADTYYAIGGSLMVMLSVNGPTVLQASYSAYDNFCGGTYTSLEGTIASPNFPHVYPRNIECIYNLQVSPGNQLNFGVKYTLEESDSCNDDYVEVREADGAGKLIDVFCGDGSSDFHINGSAWVKFKSDNDTSGERFSLNYNYANNVEITADLGVLTSPLYPIRLLTGKAFTWRISVEHGKRMLVKFEDFLFQRLESGLCSVGLTIYDGFNEDAPIILTDQCGYQLPAPMVSTSNFIFVVASFSNQLGSLFKLRWEVQDVTTDVAEVSNDKCNSSTITLGNETRAIVSPGYPEGYESNLNCTWIVKPEEMSSHAVLILTVVELEDSVDCLADYLAIYTSTDLVEWTKNASVCNSLMRTVFHGTPYLKLHFHSDSYLNKTGFRGMLQSQCGGRMTDREGVITMQGRGMRYFDLSNSQCDWKIQVRNGRTIKFEFDVFDFPNVDKSCSAFISFKNGPDEFAPILGSGSYCGPDLPQINETFSNRAFVRVTMRLLQHVNFTLRYREVARECGDEVILSGTQNSTIIHTPHYPNVPDAHSECTWNVWSKTGDSLKVEFIDRFDLTPTMNCTSEYVELRSGTTRYSNLLGRFCGRTPQIIHSPTNTIQIRYFSDVAFPKNGFKVRVSIAGCDRTFRQNRGIITSPVVMPLVEANTVCEYTILAVPSYKVNLQIMTNCSDECPEDPLFDVYAVFEGAPGNETEILQGSYNYHDVPKELFIESHKVILRFNASQISQYHQFRVNFTAQFNNCGQDIVGPTGTLSSPGYPTARYRQKFCTWKITVPKGRRVKVEILDLDMLNSTYHFIQKLSFYNGHGPPIRIVSITGNVIPEPIYSSDNLMMITYFVINGSSIRGFNLKYSSEEPSVCEGSINESSGLLENPANTSALYCSYVREDKPFFGDTNRGTISFRIQDAQMGVTYATFTKCNPFRSQLRFGRASQPVQGLRNDLAVLCGNVTDVTIASPFTDIKFEATNSDFSMRSIKYKIYYEVDRCGEMFGSDFRISSADLPAKNGAINCAWLYKTDLDLDIQIAYNSSLIGSCDDEYISVYNGPSMDSPRLAKICGNYSEQLHSRTSQLLIQYHASIANNRTKFSLSATSLLNVCGGQVHKSIQRISTPGNGSYPNNIECIWDLIPDAGFTVNMSFVERFYLEDSANCTKDSVELLDLVAGEWVSLGRFCGRDQPGRFISSESKMRVIFKSDDRVSGDGFMIQWEQRCGGLFSVTEEKKMMSSPGYPNRYLPLLYCNYTLVAPKDQYIQVIFTDFQLETRKQCEFDNVTIYSKPDYMVTETMDVRGTYCNTNSPGLQRFKSKMWIVFRTDKFVQKKGFEFSYKLESCGGLIDKSMAIHSNPDTEKYAMSHNCIWNITAPAEKEIVIRFDFIELGSQQGCYSDYIDIFNGNLVNEADRLLRICGNHTDIPAIRLTQSDGKIVFNGGYESYRGFSANVLFVPRCSRRINLTQSASTYELSETITSTQSHMDCHYEILAPAEYTLNMVFKDFHVHECDTSNETRIDRCSCHFVEVRDGRGPFSELIGKFCGHTLPASILSTRDALYVRFVTDSSKPSTGFKIEFSLLASSCGPLEYNLTDSNTYTNLTFPMGSGNYPNNANCLWKFIVPGSEYSNMQLHFERMDIESAVNGDCTKDYLELYDNLHKDVIYEGMGSSLVYSGADQSHVQVHFWEGRYNVKTKQRYCGSFVPPVFISKTNQVFLRFKSDGDIAGKGFTVRAIQTQGCHPVYNQLQGRLYSTSSVDCDVSIDVPQNHTISMYFTSFGFYQCDEQENYGIKIYDGGENSSNITSYCGYETPPSFFSTTSRLWIRIKSSGTYDITYVATDKGRGCGGEIFNYFGSFTSALYPNNERKDSTCQWSIYVPSNLKVALRFSNWDMGSKQYCSSDYVELYEKSGDTETKLTTYCGGDTPAITVSKTNALLVRFVKTVNFAGNGFKAEFMGVFENANVTSF